MFRISEVIKNGDTYYVIEKYSNGLFARWKLHYSYDGEDLFLKLFDTKKEALEFIKVLS